MSIELRREICKAKWLRRMAKGNFVSLDDRQRANRENFLRIRDIYTMELMYKGEIGTMDTTPITNIK